MKITALKESADFATLDTEKLFSKLKSYELSHKSCPNHLLQLLMSSMRASPMKRLLYWRGSSVPCTNYARRGGDHPGAASSAATLLTSSPIAPRGTSSTPPTSTTMPTRMTPATRATRRRRRNFRRSCPERVLP
jgi:hypothetical protein